MQIKNKQIDEQHIKWKKMFFYREEIQTHDMTDTRHKVSKFKFYKASLK